ncbi:hypothetical protein [Microbacterium sp. 8M]|uniref:hypothetical protein n=1 Tax=Microbacterium sp. 8M TaxID=2653153 RepID=UPI00135BC393|nr:hypothetical protein [Microbacterium sp. 8M]
MTAVEPTVNAPGKRGRGRALDVALWIAAVPVVIAGVRLLMFSKGDPVVLRVLFENFQILPLLTASTLLVLPWATLMAAILLLLNRSARVVVSKWTRDVPTAATLGILAITVVVMTSPFPMAYWIAGAWFAVLAVSIISRVPKGWTGRVTRIVNIADNNTPGSMFYSALIVPLVLTILPASSSFWLPLEDVVTSSETHSAYVLGATDGWTTLLTVDRVVLRVPSDEVTERIVCDQGEAVTVQLLGEDADAPKCAG